jgi:hypothetical protein
MFNSILKDISYTFENQFDFRTIKGIPKEKIDEKRSSITISDDFLIINIVSMFDRCCPFNIYYGINNAMGRYSILINNKAIIYNYEEFLPLDFEEELSIFLTNIVTAIITKTARDKILYIDYCIMYKKIGRMKFREYHENNFFKLFAIRKIKKSILFEPWVS